MTEECSQCGDALPSDEWHPVSTLRDDDGNVEIHDFCDERCRSKWEARRGDRPAEYENTDSRTDGGDGDFPDGE